MEPDLSAAESRFTLTGGETDVTLVPYSDGVPAVPACTRIVQEDGTVLHGVSMPLVEPLLYVDGALATVEVSEALRPEDVASVRMVRGERARTRYGAEEGQSVVLIRTRGGG